eukprot:6346153-Pyramimonas_sp.AAC.1
MGRPDRSTATVGNLTYTRSTTTRTTNLSTRLSVLTTTTATGRTRRARLVNDGPDRVRRGGINLERETIGCSPLARDLRA